MRLQGARVVLAGARIHAGHVDVDVQRADVVAQRDEVLVGDVAQLVGLGGLQAPRAPAAQPGEERHGGAQRGQRDEPDPRAGSLAQRPAVVLRGGQLGDERVEDRRAAVGARVVERVGRGLARGAVVQTGVGGLARLQRAALGTGDDRVDAAAAQTAQQLLGELARLPGAGWEDGDVRRHAAGADLGAQTVGVGLRHAGGVVGGDPHRVGLQRVDGVLHGTRRGRLGAGRGGSHERGGDGEQGEREATHEAGIPRASD